MHALLQGSGEYALRHLLSPGAWAHEPLQTRLKDLKVRWHLRNVGLGRVGIKN